MWFRAVKCFGVCYERGGFLFTCSVDFNTNVGIHPHFPKCLNHSRIPVLLCGCTLVCSDPPVVSGYRTNTTLIEALGGNGVALLSMVTSHSRPNDVSLHPGYPSTVRCGEHAAAAALRGIEAEAIFFSSLHHPLVDWGVQRAQWCLGAENAKCTIL